MVSVRPAEEYGIGDVVLSVPCVIGRGGVDRQLLLRLSEDEQQSLQRSAEVLDADGSSVLACCSSAVHPVISRIAAITSTVSRRSR